MVSDPATLLVTPRSFTRTAINAALRPLGLQIGRHRPGGPGYDEYLRRAVGGVSKPVMLDIGANTGQSARQFLRVSPDAEVHSFEPSVDAFREMVSSVKSPGFHAYNIAIGDVDGVTAFHQFAQSQTASCLPAAPGTGAYAPYLVNSAGTLEVPVRRLDTLLPSLGIAGAIDYMKIDVQGYEDRVLRGATDTLARTRFVMVEANFNAVYAGSCLVDTLCHLLYVRGFRLRGTVGYLLGEDIDELLSADFLFERVAPANPA